MEDFTVTEFIKRTFIVDKKLVEFQGYSFKNKYGDTMMIAYGENRRDFLIEVFKKKLPYRVFLLGKENPPL